MPSTEDFELRIMDLEQRLQPIADRPVDITQPGWAERLVQLPHPFDEAGVRSQADSLLEEIIACYRVSGERTRQEIRKLFKDYRAFAWAASLPFGSTTEEHFRLHLLLFAIKDQERDSRDALLWLQELCRQAKTAGVLIQPILKEVAELSNNTNRFGMGSTRDMLLRMC